MKIKCFEQKASTSMGPVGGWGKGLVSIETKINQFLADNPEISVVDIKLTGLAARIEHASPCFVAVAMVLYEE